MTLALAQLTNSIPAEMTTLEQR